MTPNNMEHNAGKLASASRSLAPRTAPQKVISPGKILIKTGEIPRKLFPGKKLFQGKTPDNLGFSARTHAFDLPWSTVNPEIVRVHDVLSFIIRILRVTLHDNLCLYYISFDFSIYFYKILMQSFAIYTKYII